MSFVNVVIKQLDITIKQISKVRAEGTKLRRDDLEKAVTALWSSYLGKDISAHDVAMCMLLMKVARIKYKATPDSYIDIAGYAAIAAEIQKED